MACLINKVYGTCNKEGGSSKMAQKLMSLGVSIFLTAALIFIAFVAPLETRLYKRVVEEGIVCYNGSSTGAAEQLSVLAKEYKVPAITPSNSKLAGNPEG